MRASEIGLPTFEPEVSCGAFCYGGSVHMIETSLPEYTEAEGCWVRADTAGAEIAALRARLAEAEALLRSMSPYLPSDRRGDTLFEKAEAFLGAADSAGEGL